MQPGTRAACVREVQKSLKHSVKLLVEDKIRTLGVSDQFEILEAEIRTPGGGIIIFQGMQNHTADSIKSLEGFDIAWVEEAQSLSQRSLDLLRPTFRKAGSELWFSWNPSKPTDPVDVLLRGEQPPTNAAVVKVNYSDNPYLPAELMADMEDDKRRDFDKYLHVWCGEYLRNSSARVFRNWSSYEFDTPGDAHLRFGADWGFASDPTVLVRCWIKDRTLFVDREAWSLNCEIDQTPELFDRVAGSRDWLITADSARPETVSYMRRHGFKIVSAVKGPGSLEDGIQFLKSYDIVVHPRCKHVIDELTHYSYKVDPLTEEVLPLLEDKNNHTIDALRYALEALRRVPRDQRPWSANPRNPKDLNQWRPVERQGEDWRTV